MHEFINNFLFGLAFGCGFCIAQGLLALVASLINRSPKSP